MLVLLLRDARIRHKAGEIIEVSPAEAGFLISTNSAVEAAAEMTVPAIETPERQTAPKTTRKKK